MSLVYQPPIVATSTQISNSKVESQQQPPSQQQQQRRKQRPGIYIGNKIDAKNYNMLQTRNITHVLNVTPPKETCYKTGVPNYFERLHHNKSTVSTSSTSTVSTHPIIYLRIPVYDSSISIPIFLNSIEIICTFINQAIQYQQTSILIHCQRGISRSVTATIIYFIRCVGMTYHDSIALIQRRRPQAQPIPEFISMLQQMEIDYHQSKIIISAPTTTSTTTTLTVNHKREVEQDGNESKNDNANNNKRQRTTTTTVIGPQRPPLSPSPNIQIVQKSEEEDEAVTGNSVT